MHRLFEAIRVSLLKGLAGNTYEIRSLPRPHYKLVEYAERELPKAGDDEWQKLINDNILELLTVFSNQGHSGTSAAYVRAALDKLMDWKPLGCWQPAKVAHTLRPERSGGLWRSCKLPDFPVVLSSPFNGLSLYLPSAL